MHARRKKKYRQPASKHVLCVWVCAWRFNLKTAIDMPMEVIGLPPKVANNLILMNERVGHDKTKKGETV